MLKIRLQRVGRKNDPAFRVVVTDSKNGPKSGKFIEILGSYDARKGQPALSTERIKYWLKVGAQASGTVHNLLVANKVIVGKKINVLPKHRPIKKVETEKVKRSESEPMTAILEKEKTVVVEPVKTELKPAEAEIPPQAAPEAFASEESLIK